jgi:hypothetical protein
LWEAEQEEASGLQADVKGRQLFACLDAQAARDSDPPAVIRRHEVPRARWQSRRAELAIEPASIPERIWLLALPEHHPALHALGGGGTARSLPSVKQLSRAPSTVANSQEVVS